MGYALRKEERLKSAYQFRRAYQSGSSFKGKALVLFILPNELNVTRAGFSVGKRKVKLATQRNRIRRILKEAYRRHKDKIYQGFDIVFLIKEAEGVANFHEAEKEILSLFRKARILREGAGACRCSVNLFEETAR